MFHDRISFKMLFYISLLNSSLSIHNGQKWPICFVGIKGQMKGVFVKNTRLSWCLRVPRACPVRFLAPDWHTDCFGCEQIS